ncbi:hypothetical protein TNCV_4233151 [Trichonephila clavipes]|nr:hypothetical protein TNCV_4233151 [Trichonephila clavipes]
MFGPVFLSTPCTVYEYVFEQCNAQQLFRVRPKVMGKPKGVYTRSFVDFGTAILRIQNAEDCGFQILHDDEIVTSVQEESDPVDDETDEDEDNNNNEVYQMLTRFLR